MFVSRLRLVNFRSYGDTTVGFAPGLNVIVGRNASGKTNLLEGAYFALRAASVRTTREEKVVRWGAGFARAEAELVPGPAPGGAVEPRRPRQATVAYAPGQGKQVRLDGVEVETLDDLRREGAVFIFVPESLLLVKGSPARRRAHLDAFAAWVDPAYEALARDLQNVLRQRNAQLFRVREGAPAASLDPWDRQLARIGLGLERRRRALLEPLAARFAEVAGGLAPDGERFSLSLVSQLDAVDDEETFTAALAARRGADVARRVSGFGPQRDDLRFDEVRGAAAGDALRDLRLFGSQGEQRAAVLALLLAERAVATDLTGDVGALLLDDVMSELDDARRRLLVGALSAEGQAIVTTTNRHYFTDAELAAARVIELAGGDDGPIAADVAECS